MAAENLTMSRSRSADMFVNQLKERVATLGLKNFQGSIELLKTDFTRTGVDKVAFTVAFNINQSPMPIEKTASGGEISRLMLAIKSIVAEKMKLPTIIFDEIDTGISGKTAWKVSEKMGILGREHQLICITHLPQIAAYADSHFLVEKTMDNGETHSSLRQLGDEERRTELARIMGSVNADESAVKYAQELISASEKYKLSIS